MYFVLTCLSLAQLPTAAPQARKAPKKPAVAKKTCRKKHSKAASILMDTEVQQQPQAAAQPTVAEPAVPQQVPAKQSNQRPAKRAVATASTPTPGLPKRGKRTKPSGKQEGEEQQQAGDNAKVPEAPAEQPKSKRASRALRQLEIAPVETIKLGRGAGVLLKGLFVEGFEATIRR